MGYRDECEKLYIEHKEMKEQIKVLLECVSFYANDHHIREYGNGQQVILESSEIADDEDGNSLPNKAQLCLEKFKNIGGIEYAHKVLNNDR